MYLLKLLFVLLLSDITYISCTTYKIDSKNDNVKLPRFHKKVNEGDKESKAEDHHPQETSFSDEENFGSFSEDSGFSGADNYFMYHHKPEKDHYSFGYRRGNELHFQERHEKAHPIFGEFQTKVKWGDIHGGQGEHYWDYNHDGGNEDSNDHHDEDETVAPPNHDEADEISDITHLNEEVEDGKLQEDERAESIKLDDRSKPEFGISLVFNVESGMIIDKLTGQKYKLQPVPEF